MQLKWYLFGICRVCFRHSSRRRFSPNNPFSPSIVVRRTPECNIKCCKQPWWPPPRRRPSPILRWYCSGWGDSQSTEWPAWWWSSPWRFVPSRRGRRDPRWRIRSCRNRRCWILEGWHRWSWESGQCCRCGRERRIGWLRRWPWIRMKWNCISLFSVVRICIESDHLKGPKVLSWFPFQGVAKQPWIQFEEFCNLEPEKICFELINHLW